MWLKIFEILKLKDLKQFYFSRACMAGARHQAALPLRGGPALPLHGRGCKVGPPKGAPPPKTMQGPWTAVPGPIMQGQRALSIRRLDGSNLEFE
jgi:hypothetical protein